MSVSRTQRGSIPGKYGHFENGAKTQNNEYHLGAIKNIASQTQTLRPFPTIPASPENNTRLIFFHRGSLILGYPHSKKGILMATYKKF